MLADCVGLGSWADTLSAIPLFSTTSTKRYILELFERM